MSAEFLEDLYCQFYELVDNEKINLAETDKSAAKSFYHLIKLEKNLTDKQRNLAQLFLKKYCNQCKINGLDYFLLLSTLTWQKEARVIDSTKHVFIEKDQNDQLNVCLKFPYNLIKEFEQDVKINQSLDIFNFQGNFYDRERKLKIISIYDVNLISLNEFVNKHNFVKDEIFEYLVSGVEQIWQDQKKILPYAKIKNRKIILKNTLDSVIDYFNKNTTENLFDNMFLSKIMGFPLDITPKNKIEKLCSAYENLFWSEKLTDFFDICEKLSTKVVIVLDRSIDTEVWIKNFAENLDTCNILRNKTRVCFREKTDHYPNFNKFIKEQGFTGPLDNAKYFIFKNRPAKWLIKDLTQFKILATTSAFKISNPGSEFWRDNHPCVIYLNEFKPSFGKGIEIVKL